jgi:hypothetical protein
MAAMTALAVGSRYHLCTAGQTIDIDQHVQIPVLEKIGRDVFEDAIRW